MKRIVVFLTVLVVAAVTKVTVLGAVGDMGFFGGITEGSRLPTTIEAALAANGKKAANKTITNQAYKEYVFFNGAALEIDGLLSVKYSGDVTDTADKGSYKVQYTLARATPAQADYITRNVTFTVNWRRVGQQVVKDYTASGWTENLVIGAVTYNVDFARSYYNVSLLEDHQAAVTYIKGDVSYRVRYLLSGADAGMVEGYGTVSGYDSPWSSTETMRLDGEVLRGDWQLSFQTRPSVSVTKTLQYSKNEPLIISFDGNYREVTQNKSGLAYDIFTQPFNAEAGAVSDGVTSIEIHSTFEQLPTVDVSALKANPAAADIHKLFSMGLIDKPVSQFVPSQLIKRGDFVTMLVKAAKMPVETATAAATGAKKKNTVVEFTFPDVLPSRADYPYIMAAYRAGVVSGRSAGLFYADYPITREEAVAAIINAMGLNNLGLTEVTHFADDKDVSGWARTALYAARRIGLIGADDDGNIRPKDFVPKAEAAALINGMIEYMRTALQTDYAEHIVNYAN